MYQAMIIAPEDQRFGKVDTMFADSASCEAYAREISLWATKWESFDEVKDAEEFPPESFCLVELQRACFRLFRWSAAHTLKVAQHCYATDKTITYPRTDDYHLPASAREEIEALHASMWKEHILPGFPHIAEIKVPDLHARYFRPDKDMDDHHAIIPTGKIPSRHDAKGKVPDSYILWDLIVRRFCTSLFAPAKIKASSRVLTYEHPKKPEIHFRALFKAAPVVDPSWLLVENVIGNCRGYGKKLIERMQDKFPSSDQMVDCTKVQKVKGCTVRPPEMDDDTLLGTMDKLNLGTAATRAEFIEDLIERDYIERRPSGFLCPRGLGAHLVQELHRLSASELLSPDLTARWEKMFEQIEKEGVAPAARQQFLVTAVERAGAIGQKLSNREVGAVAAASVAVYCPLTHAKVTEDDFQFYFAGYKDIVFKKIYIGRIMSGEDWREILVSSPENGAGPFDGFKGKNGTFKSRVAYKSRRGKYGNFKLIRD